MRNPVEYLLAHPDAEVPAAQLREEFRAHRLERLRSFYLGKHPVGWNMVPDGGLESRDKFSAEEWAYEMHKRLLDYEAPGFEIPSEFGAVLEEQGEKALLHESVTWDDSVEGVHDHDAPACEAIQEMNEIQICEYVDRAIEESRRG